MFKVKNTNYRILFLIVNRVNVDLRPIANWWPIIIIARLVISVDIPTRVDILIKADGIQIQLHQSAGVEEKRSSASGSPAQLASPIRLGLMPPSSPASRSGRLNALRAVKGEAVLARQVGPAILRTFQAAQPGNHPSPPFAEKEHPASRALLLFAHPHRYKGKRYGRQCQLPSPKGPLGNCHRLPSPESPRPPGEMTAREPAYQFGSQYPESAIVT